MMRIQGAHEGILDEMLNKMDSRKCDFLWNHSPYRYTVICKSLVSDRSSRSPT
jgi:hypothetical protein